jgi:hypothetical protein
MSLDSGPASGAIAITPSDTVTIGGCRAIYVGVTGDITIDTANQTGILFKSVPVGILPVAPLRVKATGTTATNMVALY